MSAGAPLSLHTPSGGPNGALPHSARAPPHQKTLRAQSKQDPTTPPRPPLQGLLMSSLPLTKSGSLQPLPPKDEPHLDHPAPKPLNHLGPAPAAVPSPSPLAGTFKSSLNNSILPLIPRASQELRRSSRGRCAGAHHVHTCIHSVGPCLLQTSLGCRGSAKQAPVLRARMLTPSTADLHARFRECRSSTHSHSRVSAHAHVRISAHARKLVRVCWLCTDADESQSTAPCPSVRATYPGPNSMLAVLSMMSHNSKAWKKAAGGCGAGTGMAGLLGISWQVICGYIKKGLDSEAVWMQLLFFATVCVCVWRGRWCWKKQVQDCDPCDASVGDKDIQSRQAQRRALLQLDAPSRPAAEAANVPARLSNPSSPGCAAMRKAQPNTCSVHPHLLKTPACTQLMH